VENSPADKPEYPPLLPSGLHPFTLAEIEKLCVHAFPLSTTRRRIMDGLNQVVSRLSEAGVIGELWIDGSFMTQKINAADVDIVLKAPAEVYDRGTPEQRDAIEWIHGNLKETHLCDSYIFFFWPKDHPNYSLGEARHEYWMKQFGTSRRGEGKGMAVVQLP
jgi:hypothetical protein